MFMILQVDLMEQNLGCFDELKVAKLEIRVLFVHNKITVYQLFQTLNLDLRLWLDWLADLDEVNGL